MIGTIDGSRLMDRHAIPGRLNDEAPALRPKYRVRSLAVFGGMARGDGHDESELESKVPEPRLAVNTFQRQESDRS